MRELKVRDKLRDGRTIVFSTGRSSDQAKLVKVKVGIFKDTTLHFGDSFLMPYNAATMTLMEADITDLMYVENYGKFLDNLLHKEPWAYEEIRALLIAFSHKIKHENIK